jgi:hypothetical protein
LGTRKIRAADGAFGGPVQTVNRFLQPRPKEFTMRLLTALENVADLNPPLDQPSRDDPGPDLPLGEPDPEPPPDLPLGEPDPEPPPDLPLAEPAAGRAR